MKVPKTPCPVGGQVPWMNGVYPILSKREHPVLIWLYTISVKRPDSALVIHYNVSQEEIVACIEAHCTYRKGQVVELGPLRRCRVLAMKWHFELGAVIYKLEGDRPDRSFYIQQEELMRRIATANEPL